MLYIPTVQPGFFGDFQCIPPVDLCPAGQPRTHVIGAVPVAFRQQIKLIPECRTRTDKSHLRHRKMGIDAAETDDVEELRQLVQTVFAQEAAHMGDILIRIEQMGRHIVRCVRPHRAELVNPEMCPMNADPLLAEQHRSGAVNLNGNRDDQQKPPEKGQRDDPQHKR